MAPEGPTKGRPSASSRPPGLMPTTITRGPAQAASPRQMPHTQVLSAWPPRGHRSQLGLRGIVGLRTDGAHLTWAQAQVGVMAILDLLEPLELLERDGHVGLVGH